MLCKLPEYVLFVFGVEGTKEIMCHIVIFTSVDLV
jgi:hypothetical protein